MMLKKTPFFCLLLLFLACNNSKLSQQVTEVAIYRIDTAQQANFSNLLSNFKENITQLNGYQDYTTLKDVHNPNIYVDILHWKNINDALQASEKVKTEAIYQPFTKAIDSLVAYGEFYSFQTFFHSTKSSSMSNKISEIVIYQLKSDKVAAYKSIAETTNAFLKTQKGFLSRNILQDHKDPSVFLDIVEWETVTDAETAIQNAQKEPSLMPFFEATEKVISFSHYSLFQ
jgi:heme-degrading monooxygenase HmoA